MNYTGAHSRWRKKWKGGKVPDFKLLYNPVSATKRNGAVENPRKRNLSRDEVKRLWNSIGVDALSADLAIALKLILFTGQRVEEVLQATWGEFDLEDKLWIIPAERRKSRRKNPVDHLVPLTEMQIGLIKELRGITSHKQYLFPHKDCDDPGKTDKPRGCDSLYQAIHRYCRPGETSKREAFEPFIPKDLRRTFKTLTGSIGLSLEIRNRLQGHAFQDVGSKSYDQYDYLDEKRAAMTKYSRWLEGLVHEKKAKVVQINGAA
jgi:integrase